jgi:hypothetical protein
MYRSRVSSCLLVFSVWLAGLVGGCAASTGAHAPQAGATAAALGAEEVDTIAERATTVTVEPTAPTDDTTICRKEQITGSHRTKTVCQTQAERRAVRSEAQEWFRTGGREGTVSRVPTVH